MNIKIVIILTFDIIPYSLSIKSKGTNITPVTTTIEDVKKNLEHREMILTAVNKNKSAVNPIKITNVVKAKIVPGLQKKKETPPNIIPLYVVQQWAKKIWQKLINVEARVVRRDELLKSFSDIKMERRSGSAIVDKMSKTLEDLLRNRARAAEEIMKKAEQLADTATSVPDNYQFNHSIDLNMLKKNPPDYEDIKPEKPLNCRNVGKMKLFHSGHFDGEVALDATSVHVALEVFDCDPRVLHHLHWSEGLLSTFQKNYAQDATMDFQYFCSAQGFLRHYPAALWDSMYKLKMDAANVYDCRLRPWYVSAGGAPRDVLILLDASGSMNSSNNAIAEQFTMALLNALTDDDLVNVLRFNRLIQSPIPCFNEKLVPANHVNSAAMMSAMKSYVLKNESRMEEALIYAVSLLKERRRDSKRPPSCQQAVVLLTDSMNFNFTDLMRRLDRHGRIRLFVLWLHDRYGIRDNTKGYADWISCNRDGYFAELISSNDATEQVMKILRVLERPLVAQRTERLKVFSDVYAHVEDPRRSEYYWRLKENAEQAYRYKELRLHKDKLLNQTQLHQDYMYQEYLDKNGFYYEGEDLNYRLQISVSVPVFDDTSWENITIQLDEEKQRNSTRTYPVNRLLGVAGVDIPIDHLKLIMPYHQLGPGGALFIVDHRGNVVLHDNLKPSFDGDILKPGYRTVDFLDLEQPAENHLPRHYPAKWLTFRKKVIVDLPSSKDTMNGSNVYESGMRVSLEMREYHWRRVLEHYTAVVVLPPYARDHAVPAAVFTQQLAEDALKSLSRTEYTVHPDWLYCRHIEPHFETREAEVRHFLRRRSDEPNFLMNKLKHIFSPIQPTLLEKTYQCNEELMARLSKEAIATDSWAREHEIGNDCVTCELGSVTAFFSSESGLTRWQQYHAVSAHAPPPNGSWWSRGPSEPYYQRAAAANRTLLVHAPLAPVRHMRNTFQKPPHLGVHYEWFTAARTLGTDKGIIGVAGYHFHPQHLEDMLSLVTNHPGSHDDDKEWLPSCDGISWSCVLVDEGGWVLASEGAGPSAQPSDVRQHLSTLHPAAMAALLEAQVFELNWLHDYQGVCFPPVESAAAPTITSMLRTLWHSMTLILWVSQEIATFIAMLSTTGFRVVTGDTQAEREKRRGRVWKDFERERFDRLHDYRVLVNRTHIAACDRSRAFYVLQHTEKAKQALSQPAQPCAWPLVAASVPDTNLLLIAVYKLCPDTGHPLHDPLVNEQYLEVDEDNKNQSAAAQLACWRNREPLDGRPPHTTCFPHNYSLEQGYRQCGPWLPDLERDGANHRTLSNILIFNVFIIILSNI